MASGMVVHTQAAAISPYDCRVEVTQAQIRQFLQTLEERGCNVDTIKSYQHNLQCFFADLPESKSLCRTTVAQWRCALLAAGYRSATLNQRLSTINSFLEFLGLREYQVMQ